MHIYQRHYLLILAILLISACGGGGTGSNPPPSDGGATQNAPPIADAGLDLNVDEQSAVILNGSGTDSDGSISTYIWLQTEGDSVTLSGPDTATPSFTSPSIDSQITLTFQLTVTDDDGASATDSTVVTIDPFVTAKAGIDSEAVELSTVTLDGSGSEGNIVSYAWALESTTSNAGVTLVNADSATTSFTLPNLVGAATYTLKLTVIDDDANVSEDTVVLTGRQTPGFTISDVTGNTVTNTSIAEFSVSPDSAPTADVIVSVESSNIQEGLPYVTELVFTSDNWLQSQTVAVRGQNENVVDGVQNYQIVLGAAQSSDSFYNGLDPDDVALQGIELGLETPTGFGKFIPYITKTIDANVTYTGYDLLTFSLTDAPATMSIDSETGNISWTAVSADEGTTKNVTLSVTDGTLTQTTSFQVEVATSSIIGKAVENNFLTVTDVGTGLENFSITAEPGIDLSSTELVYIPSTDVPAIPSSIMPLSQVFQVVTPISGESVIKFPTDALPQGQSFFDVKLFYYAYNLVHSGNEGGWLTADTEYDLEGSAANPTVVITARDMEGIYLIGAELQSVATNNSLPKSKNTSVNCVPLSTSTSPPMTTYKTQFCDFIDSAGSVQTIRIEGFGDANGPIEHWASFGLFDGVTIDEFLGWVLEVHAKLDTLNLDYTSTRTISIEDTKGPYGSYDGFKLRISPDFTREEQRNTLAHEYFHDAHLTTIRNFGNGNAEWNSTFNTNSWAREGLAHWFEDYFDDEADTYQTDDVVTPKILKRLLNSGLNFATVKKEGGDGGYHWFALWKLLHAKCNFEFGNPITFILLGLNLTNAGIDNLESVISTQNCSLGAHLGPADQSKLMTALAFYQYATVKENRMSLLDSNEKDDGLLLSSFGFEKTPYEFDQSSISAIAGTRILNFSHFKYMRANAAQSFVLDENIFSETTQGGEVILTLEALGLNATDDEKVIVSITSDDASFAGNSLIDNKQHLKLEFDSNTTEYTFLPEQMKTMFVTVLNPNNHIVNIPNLNIRISAPAITFQPGTLVDAQATAGFGSSTSESPEGGTGEVFHEESGLRVSVASSDRGRDKTPFDAFGFGVEEETIFYAGIVSPLVIESLNNAEFTELEFLIGDGWTIYGCCRYDFASASEFTSFGYEIIKDGAVIFSDVVTTNIGYYFTVRYPEGFDSVRVVAGRGTITEDSTLGDIENAIAIDNLRVKY